MKIHKFKCNFCGIVAGLDGTLYGLPEDLSELVNPRNADIHICWECLKKLTQIGLKMNLLGPGDIWESGESDDKEI